MSLIRPQKHEPKFPTQSPSLAYNAFGYGAPFATLLRLSVFQLGNIQPSLKPNLFVAPYVVTGGLGMPEITTAYEGSNVVSFDAESAASGCYVATNNGAEAPGFAGMENALNCRAKTDDGE